MVKGTLRVLSVGALVAAAIERLKDLKVGVRAAAAESTKTREALRESEERYRMLVENADDPIGLKDREGRFTMVNSQMEFLLGGSKEEIYGKTSAELFPGQAGIDIHKADQRVLTSGTVIETEQEIPTSLGLRIYVTRKLPIRDQSGEVVGLQSISRDITERRKAEEELRKSEELYRVVVDNAGDSIYTKDAAGRYVMVNSEFERRVRILNSDTSLSREGICGRTTPELFPAPVAARIMDADEKVLSTGMPVETELRVPTDSVTWTHFSRKVPLRDEDGHVTGLVGVSRDITERKLAEAALTQSQERFNAFLNHLPGSAFLKDSDGTYLYVNAGAAAFGWEKARCEGLTDEQLFSPEIAEQYKRNDRIVLETGHSLQTLEPIEGLDGGVALVTKFPIAGEDGVTRLVGGISIDVTDSEAAKQELRKSEELYRGSRPVKWCKSTSSC